MAEQIRHVVFTGAYGAGKRSLMCELAGPPDSPFFVQPNVTNRPRQEDQSDAGLVFATPAEFEAARSDFMSTFKLYAGGRYEYGVPYPLPDPRGRISMRALPPMPEFPYHFKQSVEAAGLGGVLVCRIDVSQPKVLEERIEQGGFSLYEEAGRIEVNERYLATVAAQKDQEPRPDTLVFVNDHPDLVLAGQALHAALAERLGLPSPGS